MLGRAVPWISWDEWQSVRNGLFSASWETQQHALDQVGTKTFAATLAFVVVCPVFTFLEHGTTSRCPPSR